MRAHLLRLDGVRAVEASPVTGSLLISYDQRTLPLERVWAALGACGCAPGTVAAPVAQARQGYGGASTFRPGAATEALVEALARKAAEASVMLVLRAFI